MKNSLPLIALFVSTAAFCIPASAYAQNNVPPAPQTAASAAAITTLQITTEAQTRAAPDLATISAGVMTSAPTAQEAMQDNAAKMTSVFAALQKEGIAQDDIQSAGININAQYAYKDNEPPTVTGYQANNNVTVRLHKMDKIGEVLDTLVKQGANQLNGPNFSVQDSDAVLDSARTEAVKKARARAELYATAAGMHVSRIINISEQTENQPPIRPMMMKTMEASASAQTPVAPGQVDLGISLSVTFELTR